MAHELNPDDVRFYSGQSNPELAAEITSYLSVPLHPTKISRYSNDNLFVQLGASLRGRDVFLIQSLIRPVSDHIIELFMMCDIARSAGARHIHAIIPYYSYARSDKKDAPRISITARLIADLLQASGATHVMTMTLHSPQVHGFFSVPTDPLTARHLLAHHFSGREFDPETTIVIAPDTGRANAAARFASQLGLGFLAAEKKRISDVKVEVNPAIVRHLRGYHQALIYDDEIATGSSVIELVSVLKKAKINEVSVICTHGVFTNNALPRLACIPEIKEIVTTNTVPIPMNVRPPHLTVLSVGSIFGEAIYRNQMRLSIGEYFSYSEGK